MKDMHNEEEGDGLAVPLPDRLAGTHRRPAGRVRDLLPRLAPPSGSLLVGLGLLLLLQLDDHPRAELVGDGMADRVALAGGTLTIDTTPDRGTVLTVALPIATPPLAGLPEEQNA